MRELESLLTEHETAVAVGFNNLKHRVQCYAHIINICSSHIISSVTSVSKQYLSELEVPVSSNPIIHDSKDESDDDDIDPDRDIDELEPGHLYDNIDASLGWVSGIKRDPLRRARRVVRLLRSSD
jgi:hypothetical protein